MSEYQQKDNTATLFFNKEKDDSHPGWADFKGKIVITEPGTYHVDLWKNHSDKSGETYLGLKLKKVQPRPGQGQARYQTANTNEPVSEPVADEDIPF